MTYSVNFADMTEKINPLAFAKYLKDTGWNLVPTKRTCIKIFQIVKSNNEAFQVIIPLDKTFSDYKYTMYQAVETVAYVESRSTEQLLFSLLNSNTAAIEKLKESSSSKTRILGKIKKLESTPDASKRISGKITVVYLDDDDTRRTATASLSKEDYDKAIIAHSHGDYVEIIGDMQHTGKRNASILCDSFAIIE